MNFRAGLQSFELLRTFELPRPLDFQSREDALKWLKQLGFLYPQATIRFREYLAQFSDDPQCFRLTDHAVLDRMAELLYARRALVVAREERNGPEASSSKTETIPVAFPLSERASRRTTSVSSQPAPVEDPPTFDSRIDAVAQAAALVAVASESLPFCPE